MKIYFKFMIINWSTNLLRENFISNNDISWNYKYNYISNWNNHIFSKSPNNNKILKGEMKFEQKCLNASRISKYYDN
jgi:hypothetical protein